VVIHARITRRRSPSTSQFWCFPSIYAYTLWGRITKFHVITLMERGVCLGVSHASHSKKAEFQRSPISAVLLYLCPHRLTENDQTRQGVTYGEGRVLGGQPRHCICTNASRGWQRHLSYLPILSCGSSILLLCAQIVIQLVKRISWIHRWCHRK